MDASGYFTGLASVYDQHRPTYPLAAIEAALDGLPQPVRAADIGCGTGISTRLLADAGGAAVIGIDPNPDMLAQAVDATREMIGAPIHFERGEAERTGLDDASVDLVLCAQSFHWFRGQTALREFHRVLSPGGRLALMWNVKLASDAFSAGFCDIAERAQADAAERGLIVPPEREGSPDEGGWFTNVRTLRFDNPQRLSLEGVLGRMRSASYFPKSGPRRETMERELRELFDRHQRDGVVALAHDTILTLADRTAVFGHPLPQPATVDPNHDAKLRERAG